MSEDLVKRLRERRAIAANGQSWMVLPVPDHMSGEAADRIEALEKELAEAQKEAVAAGEDADQARSDADEAADWPNWAQQILNTLKRYGFEYMDFVDEIDLPQDMAEWLDGYDNDRATRNAVERATTAEQALASALERLADIHTTAILYIGGEADTSHVAATGLIERIATIATTLRPSPDSLRLDILAGEIDGHRRAAEEIVKSLSNEVMTTQDAVDVVAAIIARHSPARADGLTEATEIIGKYLDEIRADKPGPTGDEKADQILDLVMAGIDEFATDVMTRIKTRAVVHALDLAPPAPVSETGE